MILAVLLLDSSLVSKMVQEVKGHPDIDGATLVRTVQGYEELCDWADNEWCVQLCAGYRQNSSWLVSMFECLGKCSTNK